MDIGYYYTTIISLLEKRHNIIATHHQMKNLLGPLVTY